MKICILSDSHDNIPLLCAAVFDAKQRGAIAILHCGDIVAPSTLQKLSAYGLPIHAIHGNNTGDLYSLAKLSSRPHSLIQYYGQDADITLDGRRIFLVHYPHYAKGMAATGNYDVVCCGHTHRVAIDTVPNVKGGQTIICNPGTVGGVGGDPATYLLGDLNTLTFETVHITSPTSSTTPPLL
jgi:uncharacterized protein